MKADEVKRQYLTAIQAANYCCTSAGHMASLRSKKLGPNYLLVGRKVIYEVAELDRWILTHKVETQF